MKIYLCFFLMVTLFSLHQSALAQTQQDTTYQIQTRDGNEFVGKIVFQDSAKIRLNTEKLGEVTIQRKDIQKLTAVAMGRMIKGKYWFDNPQAARYLWAPNGYGLRKGEAYYQNVWVLFNQVSVGVTNNFSIGAGLIPLFMFSGASTPMWITPKFSIPIAHDKVNLGVGALIGTVAGESHSDFGLVYGITTLGSRDNNVSLGLGYGYAGGQWGNTPTVSLSTMLRISPKSYFISENYYIDTGSGYLVMTTFGGRWVTNHVGLDYGIVVPFTDKQDGFIAIPWLGVTIPFGRTGVPSR
jgi:hypothetical protein